MAIEAYLKLAGVDGESVKKGHEGQIELLSFSWGVTQQASFQNNTGGGSGKAFAQDLHISKQLDATSTKLFQKCAMGEHIATGELTFRKAGGPESVPYFVVKLTDLIVTSSSFGGSSDGDLVAESVSLAFAKISQEYKKQDNTGKGTTTGEMVYDFQKNTKG